MKKVTIVLALLCATHLHAEENYSSFAGIQFGQMTYNTEANPADRDVPFVTLRLGVNFSENISGEFRYGFGVESVTQSGIEYEIEQTIGLYSIIRSSLSDQTSIYGLVGYTEAEEKDSIGLSTDINSERGVSLGIGADYKWLNVELTQYMIRDELEATTLTAGINLAF